LTLNQYESFLPGEHSLRKLVDWVRQYLCFELDWDVRLALESSAVPRLALDGRQRLGLTTWLGRRRGEAPADDLCVDAEAWASRMERAA
jgi:type VI secretion system protein ImpH